MQEHIPVLIKETIEYLDPKPGENFIDCTLGYGGHSKLILEKIAPNGKLLAIDQDEAALAETAEKLKNFSDRIQFEKANFTELGLIIRAWPVDHIDGILIDLGVSTPQLTGERGFSFNVDALLDMRMDPRSQRVTAADIVNKYSENEIFKIIAGLGEEKFARQIAKKIVEARYHKEIATTAELVEIIKASMPPSYRFGKRLHFATNTFRALRMVVNEELENIEKVLPQAAQILSPGGRLGIISFQSLEDRIVKNFFRDSEKLEVVTKKPIIATEEEIVQNAPSRSAKLRVAKKI
jgi:16S rRNA (cytosine1402-N4)-methyltransferase